RRYTRRRSDGRGRDAEREDDPLDSAACGSCGAEKGEAPAGFRSAWRSDDDEEGFRCSEPGAGADWRQDFCECEELGGGSGARAGFLDYGSTAVGFFCVLPAGEWQSAVCETFRLPASIEAITVPRLGRLETLRGNRGGGCVLRGLGREAGETAV